MTTAEQIAHKLFEAGVRMDDRFDTGSVYGAPESIKDEIMKLWLDSIDWDIEVKIKETINARDLRDVAAAQKAYTQKVDAELYGKFETAVWQNVDAELWEIQSADNLEQIAERRAQHAEDIGLRSPLPTFLGAIAT